MDVDASAGAVGVADVATNVPSLRTTTCPPPPTPRALSHGIPRRRTLCLTPDGQPQGAATLPATCL